MKKGTNNKIKATAEERILKIGAFIISALFVCVMLYPFFFTIGNSMKDSKKIYDIPPKILPEMAKSIVIELDYTGHEGKSPEEIEEMLIEDTVMTMFGVADDLSKESVYEYKVYAEMNGKTIFISRIHQSLIQLERDYGVYAGAVAKQKVLLAKDRHKEVIQNIGYDFNLEGLSDKVDFNDYETTYNEEIKTILTDDFDLNGTYVTSGVKDNAWLLLETFKYYIRMPQYIYGDNPFVSQYGFGVFAMNTCIVIGFAILSQVFLCSICAFVISTMLGKKAAKYMIFFFMGAMMIPFASIMTPLVLMFRDMGAYDNYWALLLPFLYPTGFFVYLYKGFFDKIPSSYFEAAKIDGASNIFLYFKICMPLSKPIISLIALQTFLGNWNDFFWAWLVTEDQRLWTLNVALYNISNNNGTKQNSILGLAIITITPVILLSILFSKQLKQSVIASGIKG